MRAIPCAKLQQLTAASNRSVANLHRAAPLHNKVSAAQNGREGLQFTQDRLKAGSWELSETSKSASVSGQYRIILSAAAAGAVLKPQGGNCAVLPQ